MNLFAASIIFSTHGLLNQPKTNAMELEEKYAARKCLDDIHFHASNDQYFGFSGQALHGTTFGTEKLVLSTKEQCREVRPSPMAENNIPIRHDATGLQVVCMETFHALYGGRGDADQATRVGHKDRAGKEKKNTPDNRGDPSNSNNSNGGERVGPGSGRINDFVVPQPSRYVADWAAFGSGDKKGNGSSKHRASSARHGESGEV